jgi:hypothetical protein
MEAAKAQNWAVEPEERKYIFYVIEDVYVEEMRT